ncbi:Ribosome small subunit biogenesis RbfA-release protein RsgA [hydrothermal vent metagenome]|uniref:Ribosome small subunit biogenesis RbfA-release protein RsgA n=1 Tax=hydrothermal vent metagenome TaxID=652676 RepID=A0A3B0WG77_9ZZZZ
MAKRKLSKQQQRRIASKQESKIKDELHLDENSTQTARVISHHGRQLFAETTDFNRIKCKIRQNLGDIACGDYVLVQQAINAKNTSHDSAHNVVVAVKERTNMLEKTGFADATKPVAANIGQLVIVTALKPKPNPYLIDRYLTAAENLPAKAIVIINKIDLLDYQSKRLVDDLTDLYTNIGYQVINASMKQDIGVQEISRALSNTTSILVGLSGVGKSSIVKKILPKEEIKIGETSEATGEGKHTTTVSALYHLKDNGIIIDSPGVRDFTPTNKTLTEITNGFIDVRKFSGACKFTNCGHHNEPNCALKKAVADGALNEQRFNNYLRLTQEFNEKK